MPELSITRHLIAQLSLVGMGFDLLGGCYLSYDFLGGKAGPLRTLTRAINYVAVFLVGYSLVLGFRYAVIASIGMGLLLAIEIRIGESKGDPRKISRKVVLLLGLQRPQAERRPRISSTACPPPAGK